MKTQQPIRRYKRLLIYSFTLVVLLQSAILVLSRTKDQKDAPEPTRVVQLLPKPQESAGWENEVATPPVAKVRAPHNSLASRSSRHRNPVIVRARTANATVQAKAASAEQATDPLVVAAPLNNAPETPAPASDQSATAVSAAAAADADAVPAYQPGSIGKAKRQWAGGGNSPAPDDFAGWTGGVTVGRQPPGTGHCPRPGRGRRPIR